MKAVVLYSENVKTGKEICELYNISDRTLRRWNKSFLKNGVKGLTPKSTSPKKFNNSTSKSVIQKIISLKQKYPFWGARRLKHQFNLKTSWRTVHRVIKKKGLLIRVKAKPQPSKRFQRKHVDSMWQGDTFEFRIKGTGKVFVTGFTDDCSRFRVKSKAYLKKDSYSAVNCLNWSLKNGRIPRQIYLDNGRQFTSKEFKKAVSKHGIKLIFGKPYHPQGRGKIEKYHGTLFQELISQKKFKSLSHFRRELWKFDHKYNNWRKQEILGWKTPTEIYFNKKFYNKKRKLILKKRTNVLSTK